MSVLDLRLAALAAGGAGLTVRRFAVREAASSLFSVSVWARSPDPSLDLSALVGLPASFRVVAGYAHVHRHGEHAWSGIVSYAEQVHAVTPAPGQDPLSTYFFHIVPDLWRLTQRANHRIFQHLSIPDIVDRLLAEWSIPPTWRIDRGRYPKLEYKVQYGESDFDFFSRLLEEAGIAFTLAEGGDQGTILTLSDTLEANEARPRPPVPYADNPNQASELEFVTRVRFGREVRPGAAAFRDYDFRRPAFDLSAPAPAAPRAAAPEDRLEQYHYRPGSFLVETGKPEGTPTADDQGFARHDQKYGQELAERALQGDRMGLRAVVFDANTFDLAPGVVFTIDGHPHPELTPARRLLVIHTSFEGTAQGEWTLTGQAVFADTTYRPPRRTPKPVVHGLQCVTVVGPAGQEIHTDEFDRIRVQFPWDREGARDEHSSCWIRVHQGWGGAGFGTITLPRIGHEVLVSFLEGDPDQPVVVGRAYNAVQQVPYKLPDLKTRSTWKTDSSLGGGGFNEVMMEDQKGSELVWQQAQKDRKRLVKNDEVATVGHDRQKLVKNDESDRTESNRQRWVGIDADAVTRVHKRENVGGDSHLEVVGSRRELIQGLQSLTVDKDQQEVVAGRHALHAGKQIHYAAGKSFVAEGGDVTLQGAGGFIRIDDSGITILGTLVRINVSGEPGVGKGSKPETPEEPKMGEGPGEGGGAAGI